MLLADRAGGGRAVGDGQADGPGQQGVDRVVGGDRGGGAGRGEIGQEQAEPGATWRVRVTYCAARWGS
ncbi:hypothetical protein [Planomonospora algeriensis]